MKVLNGRSRIKLHSPPQQKHCGNVCVCVCVSKKGGGKGGEVIGTLSNLQKLHPPRILLLCSRTWLVSDLQLKKKGAGVVPYVLQ
jgi:hypothetical protein